MADVPVIRHEGFGRYTLVLLRLPEELWDSRDGEAWRVEVLSVERFTDKDLAVGQD